MPSRRSSPKPRHKGTRFEFEAIGTAWYIEIFDALSDPAGQKLHLDIKDRIAAFDQDYSRFRDDSLISLMARKGGAHTLPPDASLMFNLYIGLEKLSGGKMTPLIGQVLSDAGYDAVYSLTPGKLTVPPRWEELIEYEFPEIIFKRPALLDFGAAGKGYLVDLVSELIESRNIKSYVVDAGGDIRHRNSGKAYRVGLERPDDPTQVIGVAELTNCSITGSAGNRRRWDRFTHIINPKTLASPTDIAAVWTVADSTLLADAMSTALYFVSAETLQAKYNFEYAVLRSDFSLLHSPDFPAEFFT